MGWDRGFLPTVWRMAEERGWAYTPRGSTIGRYIRTRVAKAGQQGIQGELQKMDREHTNQNKGRSNQHWWKNIMWKRRWRAKACSYGISVVKWSEDGARTDCSAGKDKRDYSGSRTDQNARYRRMYHYGWRNELPKGDCGWNNTQEGWICNRTERKPEWAVGVCRIALWRNQERTKPLWGQKHHDPG